MGASPPQQQGAGLTDMLGSLLSGLLGIPQLPVPKPLSPQQVHNVLLFHGCSFSICMLSVSSKNPSPFWTSA